MAQLQFYQNQKCLFKINLNKSSTKIGRSPECDVVLADPEISREHATIFRMEDQFLLKKLGKGSLKLQGQEISLSPLQANMEFFLGSWKAVLIEPKSQLLDLETQVTPHSQSQTQAISHRSDGLLMEELYLEVQLASEKPRVFPIKSNTVTIGADQKNDIVLEDPYVSSRHLKIIFQDHQVWAYDLGSTNGTVLDGGQIREVQLKPGHILKLGQSQIRLVQKTAMKKVEPIAQESFMGFVGKAAEMKKLYGLLEKVGPSEGTVLILGESGSGKELVARAVHDLSHRAPGPFVVLNCGAISKELMESELFGHEKGAFTGAQKQHAGAFAQAEGGTLFLDEIGELPLELQPKLLRVLENKSFRRVGGSQELRANVRVVAATHRDLSGLVQNKKFREDLFFRLFVLPINIPALRERMEDLPLLAEHFLKEFSAQGQVKRLSGAALNQLKSHLFPGNVRELRNILMRSVVLTEAEEIPVENIIFPSADSRDQGPQTYEPLGYEKLEDLEQLLIAQALKKHSGNKTKTAQSLGIAKSTLFAKIKQYGLEEKRS